MDALALAESWRPARPRLVFADTCSSYFHEATRAQSVSGPAHLIVTDGRTVTGSIESFFPVIDALQAPDKAETWRALLVRMNDLAAARAAERRGKVEAILEPPEVYGVVPPRRP